MSETKCPDCGKLLSSKMRCRCGWCKDEELEENEMFDGRCHYHWSGRRCVLTGSRCPYPYGKKGPWYCKGHYECLNDSVLGQAILIDGEANYEKIEASRIDWRKQLFPEEHRILKKKHF